MQDKRLILRLRWTGPIPPQPPHAGEDVGGKTEFGMQRGASEVVPGKALPDGSVLHEAEVIAYRDSKGRLRFKGPCAQGKPEEPFLYLSYRHTGGRGWIGRGKAHLLSLTEAFIESLPEGAVLESTMSNLGHRPAGHVQTWRPIVSD